MRTKLKVLKSRHRRAELRECFNLPEKTQAFSGPSKLRLCGFYKSKRGDLTTTQIIMIIIAVLVAVAGLLIIAAIKGFGTENIGFLNAVVRSGT